MMDASGESEEKVLLPSQETQQQRKNRETAPQGLAARARSLPAEVLDGRGGKRGAKPPAKEAELDEARFTAGIVQLYETVLKEPIPEKMLRLIAEIAKRERRS
jgi:hypothetical protein